MVWPNAGQLHDESEKRAAAESSLRARASSQEPVPTLTPAELLAKNILLANPEWAEDAEDGSITRPTGSIKGLQANMCIPPDNKKFYLAIRVSAAFGVRVMLLIITPIRLCLAVKWQPLV